MKRLLPYVRKQGGLLKHTTNSPASSSGYGILGGCVFQKRSIFPRRNHSRFFHGVRCIILANKKGTRFCHAYCCLACASGVFMIMRIFFWEYYQNLLLIRFLWAAIIFKANQLSCCLPYTVSYYLLCQLVYNGQKRPPHSFKSLWSQYAQGN